MPIDRLIGRDRIVDDVLDVLASERLVTLTGPGGIGKTRVAHEVILALDADDASAFVACHAVVDGRAMTSTLAEALGIPPGDDASRAVRGWAGVRPRVLVLDNLEQVHGAGRAVADLLSDAPQLRILATSRAPLHVAGEHEIRLSGLAVPTDDAPSAVEAAPATALFLRRARGIGRLRGDLDAQTAADIAAITRRLDGLPLAIELAAGRTRILEPALILERLRADDHAVLGGGSNEDGPSLAAVLDWTLSLLEPDVRRVLTAVSVTVDGFDLELASDLAGVVDATAAVERLVEVGLVDVAEPVAERPWFRLLETIRMVLVSRLVDDEPRLRASHARAMASLAERLDPALETRDIDAALARLRASHGDLAGATTWAMHADAALATRLVAGPITFAVVVGAVQPWLERVMALLAAGPATTLERARLLAAAVRLGGVAGREDATEPYAAEVIALGRQLDLPDVEIEGWYAWLLGARAVDWADPDDDERAAIARIRELAGTSVRAAAIALDVRLVELAETAGRAAVIAELDAGFREALDAGLLRRAAHLGDILGWECLTGGRLSDAERVATATRSLAAKMRDPRLEAFALQVLAITAASTGDWALAGERMAASATMTASVGTPRMRVDLLQSAVVLAALRGAGETAAWFDGARETATGGQLASSIEDAGELSRVWRTVQRATDPVVWEAARRAGAAADAAFAIQRAGSLAAPAPGRPRPSTMLRHGGLTPREIEVLRQVGAGGSDKDIAAALGITAKTASVHVANVKAKLGATSRLRLALLARDLGVVETEVTPEARW